MRCSFWSDRREQHGCRLQAGFEHFFGLLFWHRFRSIFGPQNGLQNGLKNGPKISFFFFGQRWGANLDVSELLREALPQSFGPLGAVLGRVKSEKKQTVLCENHFFENRLSGILELNLPFLGSSGVLSEQFSGPDDPKNRSKSDPEMGPKTGPKSDPILNNFWTHFGTRFGAQNGGVPGTLFSRFLLFSGSFFGTLFVPKTLFFARKNQDFGLHFGP